MAVGASVSVAGAVAPAGTLALTWVPRGLGPGVRLFGVAEAARTLDLGEGRANWQRWMGGAELAWRLPAGTASIDLHGGIVLGRLTVNGEGFHESLSHNAAAPAVSAGARVAGGWSRSLALWLDITGLYWTRRQRVFGEPLTQEQTVPQFEGLVSLGIALGRAREHR